MQFQKVEDVKPPLNLEVLGYNKEWIDGDYNPDGINICFLDENGWVTAYWSYHKDRYTNSYHMKPTHWIHKPKFN